MTYVVLTGLLFAIGLYGVLTRRDIIAVLASVEVMLGGATMLLVGLASTFTSGSGARVDNGALEAVGLLVIVVAAAEASVGLALLVAVARSMRTTRIDELMEVKG